MQTVIFVGIAVSTDSILQCNSFWIYLPNNSVLMMTGLLSQDCSRDLNVKFYINLIVSFSHACVALLTFSQNALKY